MMKAKTLTVMLETICGTQFATTGIILLSLGVKLGGLIWLLFAFLVYFGLFSWIMEKTHGEGWEDKEV